MSQPFKALIPVSIPVAIVTFLLKERKYEAASYARPQVHSKEAIPLFQENHAPYVYISPHDTH